MGLLAENKILKTISSNKKNILLEIIVAIMFILLFFSTYSTWIVFGLFLSLVISVCMFFLPIEDLLCCRIITYFSLLTSNISIFYLLINYTFYLIIFFKFIFKLCYKKKAINYYVFLFIIIYLIYIFLPIFGKEIKNDYLNTIFDYLLLFVVFELKDEINYKKIVICFCYFLLFFCCFKLNSYFIRWGDFLKILPQKVNRDNIPVFKGIFVHQNDLSISVLLSLSLLFYCKYNKKIKNTLFYSLFIPFFIFGFLTVSRLFILVFALEITIYFVLLIIRDKKKSIKEMLTINLIIFIIILLLYKVTSFYFMRFVDVYEINPSGEFYSITDEQYKLIMEGKYKFDYGRLSLYKLYALFFIKNPIKFLFGVGSNYNYIGQTRSHNLIIDIIYLNGIVGMAFFFVIIFFMFNLKNYKNYLKKHNMSYSIIIISYIFIQLINDYINIIWLILLVLSFYDKSSLKIKSKKIQTNIKVN